MRRLTDTFEGSTSSSQYFSAPSPKDLSDDLGEDFIKLKRPGIDPHGFGVERFLEVLEKVTVFFQESNGLNFLKFAYEPLIPALELLLGCDM